MVQYIAGGKGEGKTKKLIDMANHDIKTTDGHLVFIDDDRRHIFDLHYNIRFVETGKRFLSNYREFIGFMLGILSMDSDIKTIYVDGLTNILEKVDSDCLIKLTARLEELSEKHMVDFHICINWKTELLPDEIKKLAME
jgi:hypothetical protein